MLSIISSLNKRSNNFLNKHSNRLAHLCAQTALITITLFILSFCATPPHLGSFLGGNLCRGLSFALFASSLIDTLVMFRKRYIESIFKKSLKDKNGELLEKASLLGHAEATFQLALYKIYKQGDGTTRSQQEVFNLFMKASHLGHPEATFYLGRYYQRGIFVAKDETQGAQFFKRASDLGSISAIFYLGVCYLNGQGVAKDLTKAMDAFEKASRLGHPESTYNLALHYHHGVGTARNFTKALPLFEKASNSGYIPATFMLGSMYLLGRGVHQNFTKAFEFYQKASDAGSNEATYGLGTLYQDGLGVNRDITKAFILYETALKRGCDLASEGLNSLRTYLTDSVQKVTLNRIETTYLLALCYHHGVWVDKDITKALALYTEASEAGYMQATRDLNLLTHLMHK